MGSLSFCASVAMHEIKKTFTYNHTPMIAFSVRYPKVTLRHNPSAQKRINRQIQAQVGDFYRYVSGDLYRQAVAAHHDAQESGFPFHRYDAVLNYEITYNQHCHLSLYRDQYEFTGGAHGNTVRRSDTWSLESGQRLPLSSFFSAGQDYRALLIDQITQQADERIQQDPGIFFENYRALIVEYFNEEQYYLTPSGIALYYQHYEIAPYATGIVVFTVPYAAVDWQPSCCK
ncbi:MAG: DUF3298 and DUF4163 domain-containing protein [Clostridiales bacterium]|nr:DUF3298 and DUF4163 domain-containing protein [Clostridiales bacterium]